MLTLANKKIYASVKKPTITETIRLNRLRHFGHVQRMGGNRIPKKVSYMNLVTMRLRGRPRNRWQDEVREDGRLVGGKGWKERVYNREEWKKLLRTARNRHILHKPMEWIKWMLTAWCLRKNPDFPRPHFNRRKLFWACSFSCLCKCETWFTLMPRITICSYLTYIRFVWAVCEHVSV